jgi:hypothetical protein
VPAAGDVGAAAEAQTCMLEKVIAFTSVPCGWRPSSKHSPTPATRAAAEQGGQRTNAPRLTTGAGGENGIAKLGKT